MLHVFVSFHEQRRVQRHTLMEKRTKTSAFPDVLLWLFLEGWWMHELRAHCLTFRELGLLFGWKYEGHRFQYLGWRNFLGVSLRSKLKIWWKCVYALCTYGFDLILRTNDTIFHPTCWIGVFIPCTAFFYPAYRNSVFLYFVYRMWKLFWVWVLVWVMPLAFAAGACVIERNFKIFPMGFAVPVQFVPTPFFCPSSH